ncbi:MAG: TetR/AcrR family transcriptional regulator [Chloroflexi bacterium]|nr:TetR/AcrR family transcriptional regulator [Chloroflexota bacterium]
MSNPIPLPVAEPEDGRSGRSDAVANRALLLKVTHTLFTVKGPENVNITDIVQAAQVGRGTVYRHFANKGELCLALIDEQMRQFQNEMLAYFQMMTQENKTPLKKLAAFLERIVQFTDTNMPLMLETQRQGIYYFGKMEPQTWQVETVRGLLQTAVDSGEANPNLDIPYIADALLATLNAPLVNFQLTERHFSLDRIIQGVRILIEQLCITSK